MSSIYGKNFTVSIFGQSHSSGIGVTIDGIPAGKQIDLNKLQSFLNRRAPGRNEYSTKRKEADAPQFLSGLLGGVTCGAPLTAMILNADRRSVDYKNIADIPRPGHADFTAQMKYGGFQDVAGGGHFSGRLTAPLCIAGGIAKQLLEKENIKIYAHIYSVFDVYDKKIDAVYPDEKVLCKISEKDFPVIDDGLGEKMKQRILLAKENGNSVGGIIECVVVGLPSGLGEPMFDGMENKISSAVFGIPAVKGIEFGNGFECSQLYGSQNNDEYYFDGDEIRTKTNNHGGILGGITSGMPLLFRTALKPTPSISSTQKSVSFSDKTDKLLEIKGRHDPCIVARAVPCIEAACAVAVYDCLLENKKY